MKVLFLKVVFSLLLIGQGAVSAASTLEGRVVAIADGDTLTILDAANTQIKIRLAEIDAPEDSQPYGKRAQQALSALVSGKSVRVKVQTTDRYSRAVGRIYAADLDVSRAMVQQGAAWVYLKYLTDRSLLEDEAAAQKAQAGLWALPESERTPPWKWRQGERTDPGYLAPSDGCRIKGNIGKKGKIYHVVGGTDYGRTKIDESKGERWFCSEKDAVENGWRALAD